MLDRPQDLFADHALGSVVWHRASGERGVVIGYVVGLLVDYGEGDTRTEMPVALSDVRVRRPDDDEDWTEEAEA